MRKVAIVAKAGTSANAPWHDETWEIWGMPWISHPRISRFYEPHSFHAWEEAGPESVAEYHKWREKYYRQHPHIPLYVMHDDLSKFPGARAYPIREVLDMLPQKYLENTVAYMIAHAIQEGVDEIGLWGVHHAFSQEHTLQRPSITYLVGFAEGRGIKVSVAPGSPLFMSMWIQGRYGIDSQRRRTQ